MRWSFWWSLVLHLVGCKAIDYIEEFEGSHNSFGQVDAIQTCDGNGVSLKDAVVISPRSGNFYFQILNTGLTAMAWIGLDDIQPDSICFAPGRELSACPIVVHNKVFVEEPVFGMYYRPSSNKFICRSNTVEVELPATLNSWSHVTCVFTPTSSPNGGSVHIITNFTTINTSISNDMRSTIDGGFTSILIGASIRGGYSFDNIQAKIDSVRVFPDKTLLTESELLAVGCYAGDNNSGRQSCQGSFTCNQTQTSVAPSIGLTSEPTSFPFAGGLVATDSPSQTTSPTPLPKTQSPSLPISYSPRDEVSHSKIIVTVYQSSPTPSEVQTDTPLPLNLTKSLSNTTSVENSPSDNSFKHGQIIVIVSCWCTMIAVGIWSLRSKKITNSSDYVDDDKDVDQTV